MENGRKPMRLSLHFAVVSLAANLLGLLVGPLDALAIVRPQDELWVISSRDLPCCECGALNADGLTAAMRSPCGQWLPASVGEFTDAEAGGAITVFYITGNRDDEEETLDDGLEVYATLSACDPAARLRFVIWSWPSDKICGPLRDFRVKAARTDCEAYYLGAVITRLDPLAPLSLIGYSYGARVVGGALHLAGGGVLNGRVLPAAPGSRQIAARAVFLAPAIDDDWLLPGRRHGLALTQVDRLWASFNPCDPVLKRYHIIVKHDNPTALGFAGPAPGPWPAEYSERLDAENVCAEIGKTHWMENFISSPTIAARIRQYALWAPFDGTPALPDP
jgi:hypothetical protein